MDSPSLNTFADVVDLVATYINIIVGLLFGLILLIIIWRMVDAWIIHGGDQAKVDEGKQTALAGIIVLVVLSGVWGIVKLLQNSIFGG